MCYNKCLEIFIVKACFETPNDERAYVRSIYFLAIVYVKLSERMKTPFTRCKEDYVIDNLGFSFLCGRKFLSVDCMIQEKSRYLARWAGQYFFLLTKENVILSKDVTFQIFKYPLYIFRYLSMSLLMFLN